MWGKALVFEKSILATLARTGAERPLVKTAFPLCR